MSLAEGDGGGPCQGSPSPHPHPLCPCRVSLPEEPPSAPPQNVIASGRTNQSIMIQWQPPPESHQNGLLKGYIIR